MPLTASKSVSPAGVRGTSGWRQVVESLVLLAVAVVLFRSFAAEGYLISTGSMAPSLLGYHRQIVCPSCHVLFARGAAFDSETPAAETALADFDFAAAAHNTTQCPNCGLSDIAAHHMPRNEGDQLLVHKHVYEFRPPRRWEVVVFRNPDDPRQAYVKRVVGLPGERLEIIDGEIHADGELRRKPFPVQEAIRIPVSEYAAVPRERDPDWQPRWRTVATESRWSLDSARLEFRGWTQPQHEQADWVEYRHWVRTGGHHETSVPLAAWPAGVEPPHPEYSPLRYGPGRLFCTGTLSDLERTRWRARADDPDFQQAIDDLFQLSHVAPITDQYGYNATGGSEENLVHDFMVSLELSRVRGSGRFEIELTDGERTCRAVFDFSEFRVDLLLDSDPVPVRQVRLKQSLFSDPATIDFSLFDRQAILALNREPIFPAVEFAARRGSPGVTRPVRIGAVGIDGTVEQLRLFRDVYYTSKSDGSDAVPLAENQYFVLGDNSPVSVDSRAWAEPAVSRESLIGKPFVVHLPSRQAQLEWRGTTRQIRVPDFSRVRYIR